jgi:hypothetical protein
MISTHSDTKRLAKLSRGLAAMLAAAALISTPHAQSFSSGSDGSDGSLIIPANSGTVIFDPRDTSRWGRVLDQDGDGVYNFTDITVSSGSSLKFQGDRVNRPIYFLASGTIAIASGANLDLNGLPPPSDPSLRRYPSLPGSGGYAGGIGGSGSFPRTDGEGPGGGIGGTGAPVNCFANITLCGNAGTFTGNRYLLPLIGGSGGAGSSSTDGLSYHGGGGGGAILLASSLNIILNGTVMAEGRGVQAAGSGSGGSIRLVAPTITGNGSLRVTGGSGAHPGGPGLIRLEGFTISSSLQFLPNITVVTQGTPVDQATLRPASSLRVTAVDGMPVSAVPGGSLLLPDVSINKQTPINVDIEARGIPPGTVVTLQVHSQTPTDNNTLNVTAQATLSGTLQLSTATAQFTFPYGFSRGFLRATWTQ